MGGNRNRGGKLEVHGECDKQVEDQSPQYIFSMISKEKQLLCHEKREGREDTEWEWKRGVKGCPVQTQRNREKRKRT